MDDFDDWKEIVELVLACVGILAAIAFGFASYFISKAASKVSESQLAISRRELLLSSLQVKPIFRFEVKRCLVQGEECECVEIWNDGAPIGANFGITQHTYISICKEKKEPGDDLYRYSYERDLRYIPVYYWFNRDIKKSMSGLIAVLYAFRSEPQFPGNSDRNAMKWADRLQARLQATGYQPGRVAHPHFFFTIGYTDLVGEQHSFLYGVQGNWGPHDLFMGYDRGREMPATSLWDHADLERYDPHSALSIFTIDAESIEAALDSSIGSLPGGYF